MSFEIALIAGIGGMTALFTFLAFKLEDNFAALKTFFMLLSFLMVLVGLAMIRDIARLNYSASLFNLLDRVYQGYTYIFTFLVLYFIVMFILNVLSMYLKDKRKNAFDE